MQNKILHIILILIVIVFAVGCTKSFISKEEAEQKAREYIMPQAEEMANMLSGGMMKAEDMIYIFESSKEDGGYCVEFAFSYRKEAGWSIRELHEGAPSTIPLFINNKGEVEEDNVLCLYKAYPELK